MLFYGTGYKNNKIREIKYKTFIAVNIHVVLWRQLFSLLQLVLAHIKLVFFPDRVLFEQFLFLVAAIFVAATLFFYYNNLLEFLNHSLLSRRNELSYFAMVVEIAQCVEIQL